MSTLREWKKLAWFGTIAFTLFTLMNLFQYVKNQTSIDARNNIPVGNEKGPLKTIIDVLCPNSGTLCTERFVCLISIHPLGIILFCFSPVLFHHRLQFWAPKHFWLWLFISIIISSLDFTNSKHKYFIISLFLLYILSPCC